jgi:hypothetical protein
MKLKLDTPPHEEILLRYHLAKKPSLIFHRELAEEECPQLIWLYDEVEETKTRSQFSHAILLTRGYELRLSFSDLELTLLDSGNPDPSLWAKRLTELVKRSA